jgi:molecular chaperone HscB
MAGIKRIYGLEEKNYFKFFGIDEKQGISGRSLTTHYKKILTILKKDTSFTGQDRLAFANRAFETLADPIARARYILGIKGHENDFRDGVRPDDILFINQLKHQLEEQLTVEDITQYIDELKDQTQFIKDQIEQSIDTYQNYKTASGLLNRFYEISEIHQEAKQKQEKIQEGITYVVFNR